MSDFRNYYRLFSEEELCIRILKEVKEREGIVCLKCEHDSHYWKQDKKNYECKECRYRTSLKKGTIMENSNLPLSFWLSAIAYVSHSGKKINALKLQQAFGHNRYEPIWKMLKKIQGLSSNDVLVQLIHREVNQGGLPT